MSYTRKNVYANGGDFSDPILLWYARGVAALMQRKLAEPTSWRFYGAIHGFNEQLWKQYNYLTPSDQMPPPDQVALFWDQCQHGSWYFLPWHRGYLLAFEALVRDAIIRLDGPRDWALPYWNYFAPDENKLPPAFAQRELPDGGGPNPLFVEQRWGPRGDGDVYVPLKRVNLHAMHDPDFTGVDTGGSPGFGGVDTGFHHSGGTHGALETQPHDMVHVLVGGYKPAELGGPAYPGLMSKPATAGLDPVFWLHHANIDRLWEVWFRNPHSRGNPDSSRWLDGPASFGERPFIMPMPDGTRWTYTPREMTDLAALGYDYDSVLPRSVSPAFADRMESLHAAAAATEGAFAMAGPEKPEKNVEMVGSSERPVPIAGSEPIRAAVRLDEGTRRTMKANVAADALESAPAAAAQERVFLNLENVRGLLDGVAFDVYVNAPGDAHWDASPERLAGTIGLFGVAEATDADAEHAGEGLTFVLEITHIVQGLHLESALDADALDVRIVPIQHVPEESQTSIGRVTVFRQGR